MRKIILPLLLGAMFFGCSSKNENLSNLSANALHKKFIQAIRYKNIDKADDIYLELEAQYPGSMYIKTELLILYYAHLKNEEFELAKFYLNQYEKRYASLKEIPWCEYEKIRIDFLSYQNAYTNEGKILDIIKECENFNLNYKDSTFIYEVNTIYVKALLTKLYLDDKIYHLYKKEGKIKAAQKYRVKIPKNSIPPKVPWYKKIFYW
jgi:outer membrane protein assembly factor BamD